MIENVLGYERGSGLIIAEDSSENLLAAKASLVPELAELDFSEPSHVRRACCFATIHHELIGWRPLKVYNREIFKMTLCQLNRELYSFPVRSRRTNHEPTQLLGFRSEMA